MSRQQLYTSRLAWLSLLALLFSAQRAAAQGKTDMGPAPGFDVCSKQVDIAKELESNPDVQRINEMISRKFDAALSAVKNSPPVDDYHRQLLLGVLELHDKSLSVERNQACVSCHPQDTGFTNGVSLFNQTIVAFPGSVKITNPQSAGAPYRTESRKPMPYSYAPFSPILHYDLTAQRFFGGNFWDMRATGVHSSNPSADQALMPPLDPDELGFSDPACVVYRLSQAPYRSFFEQVWGIQSFDVTWPADVESVCTKPAAKSSLPPPHEQQMVELSERDRGLVDATYANFGISIAEEEASPDESPFTSKFDQVLAGKTTFTPAEQRGWQLFNGKANCDHCHESSHNASKPLFTDFAAHNIGIPTNYALRSFCETTPDQYGYTVNPQGLGNKDDGLSDFLSGQKGLLPNAAWSSLADQSKGDFQTATLRNVDLRPYPTFVKAYFHNGYAKSLKEVVHFYNTSQNLPHCPQGSPGEKQTCWPSPAVQENLETQLVGNLRLTDQEEDDLVAFMQTLTDQQFTSPETSDYVGQASASGHARP